MEGAIRLLTRLADLINDMLDVARIDSGVFQMERQPVDHVLDERRVLAERDLLLALLPVPGARRAVGQGVEDGRVRHDSSRLVRPPPLVVAADHVRR